METLKTILSDHPFVEGLKDEHYRLLEGCASNAAFKAGGFIFREGDEANQFYLLRQGNVALEISGVERGPITLMTLGEGEVLGWSWLFPPYRWRFDARVIELTRAIALDGKCLRGKCEQDHELGYEVLKRVLRVVEERLQATRLQLLNVYSSSP